MEARHVLNNGVDAVRAAPAAVARMVFHPRDIQRLDHLGVPEDMELHRNLGLHQSLAPRDTASPSKDLPVQTSQYTLPMALGIAAPVLAAIVAFCFLYRRHRRKQRAEDANDPHKSLDFGLGDGNRGAQGRKGTADSSLGGIDLDEKRPTRGGRQMSMDMVSPYLLPPELQQSRESLHSLSRTIHQQEDPYRPVSQFVAEIASRSGTPTRPRHDGSSIYTASSGAPSRMRENYTAELLPNAVGMSRTPSPSAAFVPPPRQNSLPQHVTPASSEESFLSPLPQIPRSPLDAGSMQLPAPTTQLPRKAPGSGLPNGLPNNPRPNTQRPDSDLALSNSPPQLGSFRFSGDSISPQQKSNDYGGPFMDPIDFDAPAPPPPVKSSERSAFQSKDATEQNPSTRQSPPVGKSLPANPRPERKQSLPEVHVVEQKFLPPQPEPQQAWFEDGSDYGDGFKVTPPSPGRENAHMANRYSMDVPPEEFANAGLGAPGFDARRLSMGFRPLPPNEVTETDDPEIRANRIRSFYKEYFDESKPAPQGQYYEDYDANYYGNGGYDDGNYYGDAGYYDPGQNNFVMPYAQPVTRRAMTPPPQAQRFMGQRPRQGSMGGMSMSGMSSGGMSMGGGMGPPRMPPGPRAHSSASGRMPPQRRGRPLPPPSALNTLPTPSMLKDDSFALMGATDFAPPLSYKERQTGRSESPLGERRPYSPSVPAYKPLASAYDELAAMPSPHLLRKSGTFTGLDFAPPRKFRDADTMSDSGSIRGSIRSNRSGVSAMHSEAIRRGAYRVSRLPTDQVFTKDDLSSVLKPQWGMRQGN